MKLHELKIKYEYLVEIARGAKTFELRKNDRDYQVGDLIHFVDIKDTKQNDKCDCDIYIDNNDLYKITYILKDVPQYGLDKDYCILAIKKLEIRYI